MEPFKVGGETTAYCTFCREMRLHNIVAMQGQLPVRVLCRCCERQHNYRAAPPGRSRSPRADKPATPAAQPRRTRATRTAAERQQPSGEHPLDALLRVRTPEEARSYSPFERYAVGDLLRHPSFGLGAVSATPSPGKIEVMFRDASRLLLHERPPAGAPAPPRLQPPPRRDDSAPMGASDAPPRR
ncbi:MAG: hypothetical protein RMK29_14130 [Myxococcales bacterium]|nr:hypothetical protein [Myxococcota bacterium]MDW8282849.1 hypothetical protein [Myxococcales bacterium]